MADHKSAFSSSIARLLTGRFRAKYAKAPAKEDPSQEREIVVLVPVTTQVSVQEPEKPVSGPEVQEIKPEAPVKVQEPEKSEPEAPVKVQEPNKPEVQEPEKPVPEPLVQETKKPEAPVQVLEAPVQEDPEEDIEVEIVTEEEEDQTSDVDELPDSPSDESSVVLATTPRKSVEVVREFSRQQLPKIQEPKLAMPPPLKASDKAPESLKRSSESQEHEEAKPNKIRALPEGNTLALSGSRASDFALDGLVKAVGQPVYRIVIEFSVPGQ